MGQQVKVYRELQMLNAGIITTNRDMVIVDDELASKRTQTAVADTTTITTAQVLTGILDGTPTADATYTLPTAALLVAGIANCKVGSSFLLIVNNKSASAFFITVAAGDGGTGDGTLMVAQNVIRAFLILITNVTTPAYFVYGIE